MPTLSPLHRTAALLASICTAFICIGASIAPAVVPFAAAVAL